MKQHKLFLVSLIVSTSLLVIGCTDSDGVPAPPETAPFSEADCPLGVWDGWCDVGE